MFHLEVEIRKEVSDEMKRQMEDMKIYYQKLETRKITLMESELRQQIVEQIRKGKPVHFNFSSFKSYIDR